MTSFDNRPLASTRPIVAALNAPCVATGLCVFVAPKARLGVGGGEHDEHRERRIEGAPAEGTGYLAMCGRDGVVRAVPGEGAGPSAALRSTGTQSDLSETQTPLLCVASDRDGTRVFAAGNTRVTREEPELSAVRSNASKKNALDSTPFGRAPGPFGSLRGDASSLVGRRCRHASVAYGPFIFVHGGLRNGTLLDDLVVLEEPPQERR